MIIYGFLEDEDIIHEGDEYFQGGFHLDRNR
jgi:hypothetical protein